MPPRGLMLSLLLAALAATPAHAATAQASAGATVLAPAAVAFGAPDASALAVAVEAAPEAPYTLTLSEGAYATRTATGAQVRRDRAKHAEATEPPRPLEVTVEFQ